MSPVAKRRGRPPLRWLDAEQIRGLPVGAAIVADRGDHRALVRGRIVGRLGRELILATPDGGEDRVRRLARGRVVVGLFDPGDLVVRRGVPEAEWRGGVVRCRGLEVLVESTEGTGWMAEDDLELAGSRPPAAACL
jgi:hypothetical protein